MAAADAELEEPFPEEEEPEDDEYKPKIATNKSLAEVLREAKANKSPKKVGSPEKVQSPT